MMDTEAPERVAQVPGAGALRAAASGVAAPGVAALAAAAPAPHMQLRILSGCHTGARLGIAAGELLRIGCDDDCDVLLRDSGLAPGEAAQVQWQQGRWSLQAPGVAGGAPASHALGSPALLGSVSLTVCDEDAPWQAALAPPASPVPEQALLEEPVLDSDVLAPAPAQDEPRLLAPLDSAAAGEEMLPAPGAAALRNTAGRGRLPAVALAIVAVALLGGAWAAWTLAPAPVPPDAPQMPVGKAALSPQAQAQAVKDAGLAIALADPALRLRLAANAEGGVTVSGWVDSVEQFDRLAQALSKLRPLPRLAVRTASEVLDALSDAGSAQGVKLQFALQGAGKVQARGVVATPAQRQLLLAQLRARAPAGIEIVDALRVASEQGPAIRSWLQAQGLVVTRAEWDGEQLQLGVDVGAPQRGVLERLLAATPSPLTEIPFSLQTRELRAQAPAPAQAPAERARIGDAGLPLRIRSVVGGAAPYVVLADGAKLQPGGRHGGWQLVAVAPDHVVFDGPRRLEISR
ncbi:MAG: type III secretion system inner membrane ring subunit SctD [Comamonas sp.]